MSCVLSVVIEDKKPAVKVEKVEVVDETDIVRHGYVRKTRSRAWTSKGTASHLWRYPF